MLGSYFKQFIHYTENHQSIPTVHSVH